MHSPIEVIFSLSIDVEEEFDWSGNFLHAPFSVSNILELPRFHSFCSQLGIRPTYLVNYTVANDANSKSVFNALLQKGDCEIGGHLHVWRTPPLEEEISVENTYAINLPQDLVHRKLKRLTELLDHCFNRQPRVFRAGRWGMNGPLLGVLAQTGYRVDSSVQPFYTDTDFSYDDAPPAPYWPSFDNILQFGEQRKISEFPVTAGFNRTNFTRYKRLYDLFSRPVLRHLHMIGILNRLGFVKKIQLCPELVNSDDMVRLIRTFLRKGIRVLNMYLHSSSLMPGGSPYCTSKADVARLLTNIDRTVAYLKENTKPHFLTLTEAMGQYATWECV